MFIIRTKHLRAHTKPPDNNSLETEEGQKSINSKDAPSNDEGQAVRNAWNQTTPPLAPPTMVPEMVVMQYVNPVTRVDPKAKKSRNGCITCKKRKVKCDETQPKCLRCQRFGVVCDGYVKSPRRGTHSLLPRTSSTIPATILPLTALFHDVDEYQYFIYFKEKTMPDLAGPFYAHILDGVALRSSYDEPALRRFLISIAALGKSKSPDNSSQAHQQYALQQYGKALREINQLFTRRSNDDAMRITLIASLLIYCFENLQGNQESAESHIASALTMMRKHYKTSKKPYSVTKNASFISGLDDEVCHLFVKLDANLMSSISGNSKQKISLLDIDMSYKDEIDIPSTFRSINEARMFLEQIQISGIPYLRHMPDAFAHGTDCSNFVPSDAYEELNRYLSQWSNAFLPLLSRAMAKGGEKDLIGAATLKAQCISLVLAMRKVYFSHIPAPEDVFSEPSLEVVELAKIVINDRRWTNSFVLDCGFVPLLLIIMSICPTRSIKEDALKILQRMKGRVEMTWRADTAAAIGEHILKMEDAAKDLAFVSKT